MFNTTDNPVVRPKGAKPFLGLTVEQARASRPANFAFQDSCCDENDVVSADGVVEILDTIGGWGVYASEVIPVLRAMDGAGKTIVIRINSYGGDVFEGLAIANTIADLKARTVVEIIGVAASIASIVATAADEVRIRKNAQMMIHRPWAFTWGEADDLRAVASHLDKIEGQLVETYVDRSAGKKNQAELAAAVVAETWLTGTESVAWGLADFVIEKAKAETKVDASTLEAAGIKNAPLALVEELPVADAVEDTSAPAVEPVDETPAAPVNAAPVYDDAKVATIRAAFARTKRPAAADEAMAGGLTVEQAKALAFDMLADEDAHEPVNTTLVSNEVPTPAQKSPEQVMAEIRARQLAEFQSNR